MKRTAYRAFALIVLGLFISAASAQDFRHHPYQPPAANTVTPVFAEHGMVVAQEKLAARIGADVLNAAATPLTRRWPQDLRWR